MSTSANMIGIINCGTNNIQSLINAFKLIDINNREQWYYNQNDGIQGNQIYDIGCKDDWVWFIAENGISLYNWSKYHDN